MFCVKAFQASYFGLNMLVFLKFPLLNSHRVTLVLPPLPFLAELALYFSFFTYFYTHLILASCFLQNFCYKNGNLMLILSSVEKGARGMESPSCDLKGRSPQLCKFFGNTSI